MAKTILITGASSGIGAATARACAAAGWNAVLFARSADKLASLAQEIGSGKALAVAGNVTVQSELDRAVTAGIEAFGAIDALFANAGLFITGPIADTDPDEWERMIDVNITGVLRSARAVLPHMLERGTGDFLITGSIAGRVVFPTSAAYAATKHAVYAIADGLRKEVCERGVRVAVVSPGYVANEIWGMTDPAAIAAEVDAGVALQSEDIAAAVVHVLSSPPHVNIADTLVLSSRRQVPGI